MSDGGATQQRRVKLSVNIQGVCGITSHNTADFACHDHGKPVKNRIDMFTAVNKMLFTPIIAVAANPCTVIAPYLN